VTDTVSPLRDNVLIRPYGNPKPQSYLAEGVVPDVVPIVQWAEIMALGPQCRPGLEVGLEVIANTASAQYIGELMLIPQSAIWGRK